MIEVKQGKPISKYFKIFHPVCEDAKIGDQIVCIHPKSDVKTYGEIKGMITESWLNIPDWICFDTYGVDAATIKKSLEESFEAHRNQDQVRILLIKQKTN